MSILTTSIVGTGFDFSFGTQTKAPSTASGTNWTNPTAIQGNTSFASYLIPAAPPSGGGGGGGGGCFTGAVEIKIPTGLSRFDALSPQFELINETGVHNAELIVHENYKGWMIVLGPEQLVTVDHLMKTGDTCWESADTKYPDLERVWFEGTVYNSHILTDNPEDQHYILWNGDVAHNVKNKVE